MILFRVLIVFILFSFNVKAEMSKEDIKQVFFDAESGNYKAQNYLGSMYHYGVGVALDYKKAAEWYQKSSYQGYADASVRLGNLYRKGDGVEKNYDKAKELFEKALKESPNNADANLSMGILYYNGEGVEQDDIKSAEWFRKSTNEKAVRWLKLLANSKKIIDNDFLNNLVPLAESGDANAQYKLGKYYKSYEGKNYKKALKWFTLASNQGHVGATASIGHSYYYGSGVVANNETAKEWFLKAKKMGSQEVRGYLSLIEKEKLHPRNTRKNVNKNQNEEGGVVISILALIVFYIILVGWYGYFRKLSIVISPISFFLFVVYYEDWIQSTCSGECNIRIDVFMTYPLLFGVVAVGLQNLVRLNNKKQSK